MMGTGKISRHHGIGNVCGYDLPVRKENPVQGNIVISVPRMM